MEEEKKEKEIVIDLSRKIIKLESGVYVSLGTLLLSIIIMIVQMLICLARNNWQFDVEVLLYLLNFLFAIRGEKSDNINKILEDLEDE